MTAPDQRAVPPPPPVADIWGAALADGSGRHVPVRRHWPELAAALDAEVDAAGMVPDTGQAPDVAALLAFVRQVAEIPDVACSFAMCDGPDVEPVPMKTCRTCWAVHDARTLLGVHDRKKANR